MKRFSDSEYDPNMMTTVGIDFRLKSLNVDGKLIRLQIWDTAGQERFGHITKMFYRGSHGVLFVYDISDGKSFDSIGRWLRNLEEVSIIIIKLKY